MSKGQIIFVDDDEEDHLILFEYFRDLGRESQVKFIRNGQEALRYLDGITDDTELPKLIVLDLNMPILNGTQTLLHIKKNARLKNIPVIIFSTSENENEKRKCLSLGANEYLVKPTNYMDGLKLVEKFSSYIA